MAYESPLRVPSYLASQGVPDNAPMALSELREAGSGPGELVKGFRRGVAGISSNALAGEALSAEVDSDREVMRQRLAEVEDIRRQGQADAPRVASLRDVDSFGGGVDYLAGQVGQGAASMMPSLAAGAAMRLGGGKILGKAAPFVGGFVPAYQQMHGEAAQGQYDSPEMMQRSAEDRMSRARAQGAVGGALETAVPGMMNARFLGKAPGSYAGRILKDSLGEGVTETAQTLSGHVFDKTLGSTAELSPWELADSFVGGAAGSAGVSGAMSAPSYALGYAGDSAGGLAKGASDKLAALRGRFRRGDPEADGAEGDPTAPEGDPPAPKGTGLFDKASDLAGATYDRFGGKVKDAAGDAADSAMDGAKQGAGAAKDRLSELSKKIGGSTANFLDRSTEAMKEGLTGREFLEKAFGGGIADLVDYMRKSESDDGLGGDTLEDTKGNVTRKDKLRTQTTDRLVEALLDVPQEALSPETNELLDAILDPDYPTNTSDPAIQRAVVKAVAGYTGSTALVNAAHGLAKMAGNIGETTQKVVDGSLTSLAVKAGNALVGKPGVTNTKKSNLQRTEYDDRVAFKALVFNGLTDEAKATPEVMGALEKMSVALMAFATKTGKLDRGDLPALIKVSNAMSLFKDPDAMAEALLSHSKTPREGSNFKQLMEAVTTAQRDVIDKGSFLRTYMTEEANDTLRPAQMKRVAEVIDEFVVHDGGRSAKDADAVVAGLAQVFGSEETAKSVIEFYAAQSRSKLMFDPAEGTDALKGDNLDSDEILIDEYSNDALDEKDQKEFVDRNRDGKTGRPYLNGRDDAEANAELEKGGPMAHRVSARQAVEDRGDNPRLAAAAIRRDLQKRLQTNLSKDAGAMTERGEELRNLIKMLEGAAATHKKLLETTGKDATTDVVTGMKLNDAEAAMAQAQQELSVIEFKIQQDKGEDRAALIAEQKAEVAAIEEAERDAHRRGIDPALAILELYDVVRMAPDETKATDVEMERFRTLIDRGSRDARTQKEIGATRLTFKVDGKSVSVSMESMVYASPEKGTVRERLLASLALVMARADVLPEIKPDTVVIRNYFGDEKHLTWGKINPPPGTDKKKAALTAPTGLTAKQRKEASDMVNKLVPVPAAKKLTAESGKPSPALTLLLKERDLAKRMLAEHEDADNQALQLDFYLGSISDGERMVVANALREAMLSKSVPRFVAERAYPGFIARITTAIRVAGNGDADTAKRDTMLLELYAKELIAEEAAARVENALEAETALNIRKFIKGIPQTQDPLVRSVEVMRSIEDRIKATEDLLKTASEGDAKAALNVALTALNSKKKVFRSVIEEMLEKEYTTDRETLLDNITRAREASDVQIDSMADDILYREMLHDIYLQRAEVLKGTAMADYAEKSAESAKEKLDVALAKVPDFQRMNETDRPSGTPDDIKKFDVEKARDSLKKFTKRQEEVRKLLIDASGAVDKKTGMAADVDEKLLNELRDVTERVGNLSDAIDRHDAGASRKRSQPDAKAPEVQTRPLNVAEQRRADKDAAWDRAVAAREKRIDDKLRELSRQAAVDGMTPGELAREGLGAALRTDTVETLTASLVEAKRRAAAMRTKESLSEDDTNLLNFMEAEVALYTARISELEAADAAMNAKSDKLPTRGGALVIADSEDSASLAGYAKDGRAYVNRGKIDAGEIHDFYARVFGERDFNTLDWVLGNNARRASFIRDMVAERQNFTLSPETQEQRDINFVNSLEKLTAKEYDAYKTAAQIVRRRKRIAEGKGKDPGPVDMAPVKFRYRNVHTAKDQAKSDRANKFIGVGSPKSSTAAYAEAWGKRANFGAYSSKDTVFISAEGKRDNRVDPDFVEIQMAMDAGATLITDIPSDRYDREFNVGERQVSAFLKANGYAEGPPGEWTPAEDTDPTPTPPKPTPPKPTPPKPAPYGAATHKPTVRGEATKPESPKSEQDRWESLKLRASAYEGGVNEWMRRDQGMRAADKGTLVAKLNDGQYASEWRSGLADELSRVLNRSQNSSVNAAGEPMQTKDWNDKLDAILKELKEFDEYAANYSNLSGAVKDARESRRKAMESAPGRKGGFGAEHRTGASHEAVRGSITEELPTMSEIEIQRALFSHRKRYAGYQDIIARGDSRGDGLAITMDYMEGEIGMMDRRLAELRATKAAARPATRPAARAAATAFGRPSEAVPYKPIMRPVTRMVKKSEMNTQQSAMKPKRGRPGEFGREAVIAEVLRIRGKNLRVLFEKFADIGGSGEWSMNSDYTDRLMRIAYNALNPMSVAWHESLHDFMGMLGSDKTPAERKLKKDLLAAANAPHVIAKLRILLKDHPEALQQIESDPEERLAYMFQFWAEGNAGISESLDEETKHAYRTLLVSPTLNKTFARVAQFIRELLGVMTKDQKTAKLFEALYEGKFADPSLVSSVLQDLKAETLGDRIKEVSGPIGDMASAVFTSASDRLRNTNIPALEELADMFHRDAGGEISDDGELPFMQRRAQQVGKRLNKLQDILGETTATERRQALENMQAMKPPSSPLEKELAAYLADMHKYMNKRGVKQLNKETKVWDPIGHVVGYFPRVWDKNRLRNNEAEFMAVMTKHIGLQQARATYNAIVNGDGSLELGENEHALGFTPFMPAVMNRQFTFIDASNADQFVSFQSKDLAEIMTSYTQRAVHRAEYAKSFGNNGEVIAQKLVDAQEQGASKEDLAMASKATLAMEGTLGSDFNPRLKEIMSAVMTYQNIVLLPLSLFTNLVDPIGVAVRSGEMKDAWKTFSYGIKGLVEQVTKAGPDEATNLAKMLGIIDDQNMLDAMGQVYNSMHMSPFMKKINMKFFRYNGMETWNNRMRVAAMVTAQEFMIKHADIVSGRKPADDKQKATSIRYLKELGVSEKDIIPLNGGGIALISDHFGGSGANSTVVLAQQRRVQEAVFKWVDSAVLRPNAAHRPIWGSDPRFQLLFHLKQFTYSFQNTILKRVSNEMREGNSAPVWALASYVPFMFASDVLKGSLTGTISTGADLVTAMGNSLGRSGIAGIGTFGLDAVGDMGRGNIPGSSFLGPTMAHISTIASTLTGNAGPGQLLDRSVPFVKYF